MNQTKTTYVGKNAVCVFVNLILSVICFAGCIVGITMASVAREYGLFSLLIIDMLIIVGANTVHYFEYPPYIDMYFRESGKWLYSTK